MTYLLLAVLLVGGLSVWQLIWAFISWEIRWDLRLFRLAIHSALFGAAVAVVTLLWCGALRI